MSSVKLISVTPNAEKLIVYCARVSSPENQKSQKIDKLIQYCIKHNHWSIFEMANMIIQIDTQRAISSQILRHKSFSFQEFSQRYSKIQDYIPCHARLQDNTNRQQSIDNCSELDKKWFLESQKEIWDLCFTKYQESCEKGIAKECSRFFLPLNTKTTIYMNGNIRNWIHFINLRGQNGTQKEHRDLVLGIKKIFNKEFPIVSNALFHLKDSI